MLLFPEKVLFKITNVLLGLSGSYLSLTMF